MKCNELHTNYCQPVLDIADRYHIENVRVFGSTATGNSNKNSDIVQKAMQKELPDWKSVIRPSI